MIYRKLGAYATEKPDSYFSNGAYAISTLSVMPDHRHAALRGNIDHSPEEVALAFLNNLDYALGQNAAWRPSYYAGTFSEYGMDAVHLRP